MLGEDYPIHSASAALLLKVSNTEISDFALSHAFSLFLFDI